ncbi:hypothetical protein AKJ49_02020 [candidate division MSBL1 archaeon SCGC-AAA382A03]|uniref:Peptidase M60 domain-containing protein n=1 Tax=candidate division MSBL1 archaeon SCGC-AAA382A03 TaxID=1698278 RepID=A0A133VDJ6_9EURY|nr:hypothetical protein AKJ49_02020 [candidate division MSBL1 archaeon SCGC-AAA382A03]
MYNLTEEETESIKFGGKLHPELQVIPKSTQIFVEIEDNYGNILSNYYPLSGDHQADFSFKIEKNGKTLFQGNFASVPGHGPFGNQFPELGPYNIGDSPKYEMDLNLEPLGDFDLRGDLISQNTLMKFNRLQSPHFVFKYPKGHQKHAERLLKWMERYYREMASINGGNLKENVKFVIDIMHAGAGGGKWMAEGYGTVFLGQDLRNPRSTIIPIHELGHVFSFSPPNTYGVECPWFCEQLANFLRILGTEEIYGSKIKKWDIGNLPGLRTIEKHFRENTPIDKGGAMAYIFLRLEKRYGEDIHRKFIEIWNSQRRQNLSPMTKENQVASLYSYLAGTDFSPLFVRLVH